MSSVSPVTRTERARRARLADALIAGFVATAASTMALILAYFLALAVGREDGMFLQRWFWQLTNNDVISLGKGSPALALLLHVLVGIFWSFVYAIVAEPRLPGVGWQRGMLFGLLPWLLSLFALVPAAGMGMLGLLLSAGPLPPLGNLVLHLIYGGVLGWVYDTRSDSPDTAEGALERADPYEHAAMEHSEGFAAAGILGGAVVGALVGVGIALLVPQTVADTTDNWTIYLALGGLAAGAAVGSVVGSFSGLPSEQEDPVERSLGTDVFHDNVLSVAIPFLVLCVVLGLIVTGGSTLLTFLHWTEHTLHLRLVDGKLWTAVVALVATTAIGVAAWVASRRQEPPRSSRDTVSHSGH